MKRPTLRDMGPVRRPPAVPFGARLTAAMMATSSLFLGEGVTANGLPAQQRAGEIDMLAKGSGSQGPCRPCDPPQAH
jgi:hypothetical protein